VNNTPAAPIPFDRVHAFSVRSQTGSGADDVAYHAANAPPTRLESNEEIGTGLARVAVSVAAAKGGLDRRTTRTTVRPYRYSIAQPVAAHGRDPLPDSSTHAN
jgi:hypothetical protein